MNKKDKLNVKKMCKWSEKYSVMTGIVQHKMYLVLCTLISIRSIFTRNRSGQSSCLSFMPCSKALWVWPSVLGAMQLPPSWQNYLINLPNVRLQHERGLWFYFYFFLTVVMDANTLSDGEHVSIITIHPVTVAHHAWQKGHPHKVVDKGYLQEVTHLSWKISKSWLAKPLESIRTLRKKMGESGVHTSYSSIGDVELDIYKN